MLRLRFCVITLKEDLFESLLLRTWTISLQEHQERSNIRKSHTAKVSRQYCHCRADIKSRQKARAARQSKLADLAEARKSATETVCETLSYTEKSLDKKRTLGSQILLVSLAGAGVMVRRSGRYRSNGPHQCVEACFNRRAGSGLRDERDERFCCILTKTSPFGYFII